MLYILWQNKYLGNKRHMLFHRNLCPLFPSSQISPLYFHKYIIVLVSASWISSQLCIHSNIMPYNCCKILFWIKVISLKDFPELYSLPKVKNITTIYLEILQHKSTQGMCLRLPRKQGINKLGYEPRSFQKMYSHTQPVRHPKKQDMHLITTLLSEKLKTWKLRA